jgi:hypothetical protein
MPFLKRTVPLNFANLRFLGIAIAVFLGAALGTRDASAACTSMPDSGDCPAVCRCCETSEPATPIQVAADQPTVDRQVTSSGGIAHPQRSGCVCRSQSPVAPQPNGHPNDESGRDSARDVAAISWLGSASVAAPSVSFTSAAGPPLETPLHLRTSRLLI